MTVTVTATQNRVHGELECLDAESILHETTLESADLRARLTASLDERERMAQDMDRMRLESDRLRALLDDVSRKNNSLITERDGFAVQVKYLSEELTAVEEDAVPTGTLLFAPIAREVMVSEYRRVSRINRGPLPPSVLAAVETARDQIVETMTEAGTDALTAVIRREVRRRRRTQNQRTRR